eukprot:Em0007g361a
MHKQAEGHKGDCQHCYDGQCDPKSYAKSGVKYLYVNTDNGIYKLPLERCGRFQGCSGCVASRDPYCVWDTACCQCVTLPGNPDGHNPPSEHQHRSGRRLHGILCRIHPHK